MIAVHTIVNIIMNDVTLIQSGLFGPLSIVPPSSSPSLPLYPSLFITLAPSLFIHLDHSLIRTQLSVDINIIIIHLNENKEL